MGSNLELTLVNSKARFLRIPNTAPIPGRRIEEDRVDWNKAFNWVLGYVLRWTLGSAVFGAGLEYLLSLSHGYYRAEVPVLLTLLVFSLSMMGGVVSLYMVWLMRRYQGSAS